MIELAPCPKHYTKDQDKAVSPHETLARVRERIAATGKSILARTRRIDTGRLDIPVFLSECGADARAVMPTRKQMGKGASPEQAEASALMELVERYSFFTRWNSPECFTISTYSQALQGEMPVMPVRRVLQSVLEDMPEEKALEIMDLRPWRFHPATVIGAGREESIPLEWFKALGEFNGSSAGNTHEESILQGACELVERHVCALAERHGTPVPTIDLADIQANGDPVLRDLLGRFQRQGIVVLLKDMTLGMPVPTVAALCYDPGTFPHKSEIVYTAGTATSPAKAAIRALTEIAQLAGDFCTEAVYEASGLPKYESLAQAAWLFQGAVVPLDSLPSIERPDFRDELLRLCQGLAGDGYSLYCVDMTAPSLGLPAHYNIVPGFQFRERDAHASLGLFVGRKLAEESPPDEAVAGLETLARHYPGAHFLPFFRGMLTLRMGDAANAARLFEAAAPLQPDTDSQSLAAFYAGYSLSQLQEWEAALPFLDQAVELCAEHKEYFNLRGVAKFKLARYAAAAGDFDAVLKLDRGSAMDLANLGMCHKFMGERAKATEFLGTALELDPSLEFARTHLQELGE
jgi:ribosomal protein S12 methylthiotransferase accessory factor